MIYLSIPMLCLFVLPNLPSLICLQGKHSIAVGGCTAFGFCLFQEQCFRRIVNQIEDIVVRLQFRTIDRRKACFVRVHSAWGGVDYQLKVMQRVVGLCIVYVFISIVRIASCYFEIDIQILQNSGESACNTSVSQDKGRVNLIDVETFLQRNFESAEVGIVALQYGFIIFADYFHAIHISASLCRYICFGYVFQYLLFIRHGNVKALEHGQVCNPCFKAVNRFKRFKDIIRLNVVFCKFLFEISLRKRVG